MAIHLARVRDVHRLDFGSRDFRRKERRERFEAGCAWALTNPKWVIWEKKDTKVPDQPYDPQQVIPEACR